MSDETLTGLVDALDQALDQVPLLDDVERALRNLRAALPRYEAAMRLAEAWVTKDAAANALILAPTSDNCIASYGDAQDELNAANAAYRRGRA